MSHSRKHLTRDALNSFPVPAETETIAKVVELRGSNICCVLYPDGERVLAQIPNRFSKLIWIKRGSYVIVKQPPNITNYKVRALVEHILFADQIKHIKSLNLWPAEFTDDDESRSEAKKEAHAAPASASDDSGSDSDEDADLFVNPNRVTVADSSSDDEDDDKDENDYDQDSRSDLHPGGSDSDDDRPAS
eukprot:TRINITY_DN415_c0_g1_i1.p2 TRINITY_DN415_c0_g1~~TRINITY_DN415_c0_g1_i1.p2  ORF type:complete len:190 (+),score=66.97 TRINITY_DN415_c0_g1_i1:128-697(+)